MSPRTVRRVAILLLLLFSLALIAWGVWPLAETVQVTPLQPSDMQLPEPHNWLLLLGM